MPPVEFAWKGCPHNTLIQSKLASLFCDIAPSGSARAMRTTSGTFDAAIHYNRDPASNEPSDSR
jgi:hypothetical protein